MYLRMNHRRLDRKSPMTSPERTLDVTINPNFRVEQKQTSGPHYFLRKAHRSRNLATSGEPLFQSDTELIATS